MNHLIVDFKPFTLEQSIMVYINGECVNHTKAPIEQIPDIVNGLRKQYNINQVDLCGNSDYLSRFKAEMALKFANHNVNIDIISR